MDKEKVYSRYVKELLKCHELVLKCRKSKR